VFDLKAVNPTAVVDVDIRTPQQIIDNIEAQGRIVADALARLSALTATPVIRDDSAAASRADINDASPTLKSDFINPHDHDDKHAKEGSFR